MLVVVLCDYQILSISVSETTIVHFLNKLIVLCKEAVCDWGILDKYIKRHENSADHLHCKDKSENFIAIAEGKKHDVVSMLSSAFAGEIERNREILKSILNVIVLCLLLNPVNFR